MTGRLPATIFFASLTLGLGCAGLFSSVDAGPPAVDRCGHVTTLVTFSSSKRPRELVVSADGAPLHTVPIAPGATSAEVRSFVGANARKVLSYGVGRKESAPVPVQTPPWDVALTRVGPLEAPAPQVPPATLKVLAPCSVDGVLAIDADLSNGVPLARGLPIANGEATLEFPPLAQGDYEVRLKLGREGTVVEAHTMALVVGPPCIDEDGDGVMACEGDCDDADPRVHPGATDIRGDGIDNDCDGINGVDVDRDGWEAKSAGGGDCDDRNPDVNPGQQSPPDHDGDGAYTWRRLDWNCDGTATDAPGPFDCDDNDPERPRPELPDPNGIDDDCDGKVDEGTIAYDDDGDGYAELQGDCNDADTSVYPNAVELPDCKDNDCDNAIDDGVTRPAKDDSYEPNDTSPYTLAGAARKPRGFLGARGHNPTSARLSLTTRDTSDVETFEVWTHDGVLDTWHVTADIESMGDARSYEVTISGPAGRESEVIHAPGGAVRLNGRGLESNTGTYQISIRPQAGELPWCPVIVTVSSG